MKLKKLTAAIVLICTLSLTSWSQTNDKPQFKNDDAALQGWHIKDKTDEGFYGISLNKAYAFLKSKNKKSKTVIVGVIDSGIDTTHEDLKEVLWTNTGEIPGNGIDDDKNGYVDDVHGWNFLGGKDGRSVNDDSFEGARVYHNLMAKYEGQTIDESKLNKEQLYEYKLWKRAKEKVEAQGTESQTNILQIGWLKRGLPIADSIIKIAIKKDIYTGDELEQFEGSDQRTARAKLVMMAAFEGFSMKSSTNKEITETLNEYYNREEKRADAVLTAPKEFRNEIVKDNYYDFTDRFYGNNDIMASRSLHGTHVSGLIAAKRDNGKGIDGVADNVKIMMLRAVPDGDEHDKDIALAIRYAVDNGAQIINMSFGKSFSPEKKWVDEAIKYAASKNVLIVHAAGNDAENNDVDENFPNKNFIEGGNAVNYISVGASSDPSIVQKNDEGKEVKDLTATFSNYGKKEVDVFAPGVKTYSTEPGDKKYGYLNGTSFASPIVAGIAALTLSYYPNLTTAQLKQVILKSAQKPAVKVLKPGTAELVTLSDLSQTGGLVNAYEAVKLAESIKVEKKKITIKPKIIKTKKG